MRFFSTIFKNTALNLLGLGLPMVVAFFSIPYLVSMLGAEKFGLLALIWAVVSYVGVFDLGMGRALTLQLSRTEQDRNMAKRGGVIGTAYGLMLLLGLVLAMFMLVCTTSIVSIINEISDVREAENAFRIMVFSIPFIIVASGFKGVLEASHEFAKVNFVRFPIGVFTFAGPALVVCFLGSKLEFITLALALSRAVGCLAYGYFALLVTRSEHRWLAWDNEEVKALCISGGWISIASVVGPLMGYADRFMLAWIVSASAVAYYVTPSEIVTKLWIIPGALTAVLFPVFSSLPAKQCKRTVIELFDFSSIAVFLVIAPISLALSIFSFEVLRFWVGEEFAMEGRLILTIFAFAVLINCLAHVPLTLLQGSGRAKHVALLQVLEVPIFIYILWVFIMQFGVVGAAWVWVLRAIFDTSLMLRLAASYLGLACWRYLVFIVIGLVFLVVVSMAVRDISVFARLLVLCSVGLLFCCGLFVSCYKYSVLKRGDE